MSRQDALNIGYLFYLRKFNNSHRSTAHNPGRQAWLTRPIRKPGELVVVNLAPHQFRAEAGYLIIAIETQVLVHPAKRVQHLEHPVRNLPP
jgi:hypothetical protein